MMGHLRTGFKAEANVDAIERSGDRMVHDFLNHRILAILSTSLTIIDAPQAAQDFACIDAVDAPGFDSVDRPRQGAETLQIWLLQFKQR